MVPEAGVAVALLTNGGDVISLYHDVVGHVLDALTDARLPGAAAAAGRPASAIDAGRFVGTYSAEVFDLTVSQDDDGRIWIEQIPKGVFEELGGQAERTELVALPRRQPHPARARPRHAHAARLPRRRRRRPRPLPPPRSRRPARRTPDPDPPHAQKEPHMKLAAPALGICVTAAAPHRLRRRATAAAPRTATGGGSDVRRRRRPSPWRSPPTPATSTRSPRRQQPAVHRQPARLRQPGLASTGRPARSSPSSPTDWKVDGTTVTLTLAEGHHLRRRQRLHRHRRSPTTSPTSATRRTRAPSSARSSRPAPPPRPTTPPARSRSRWRSPRRSCSTAWPACRWSATPGMKDRDVAGRRRPRAPARTS